jgi:type VI secretion system protein ImpH
MGSDGWRTDASVKDALFDYGYEFEFFQAARLLALLFPNRKLVGSVAKPEEEFARFVSLANCNGFDDAQRSMAFPASAVHNIEADSGSPDPPQMTVAFMGLTGVQGVLPLYYTERMLASKAAKDNSLAAFLDIFNHRVVSLFYRAWEKHRPAILYEMAAARNATSDPFTCYLFSLIGMGTSGLCGRLGVIDESLLLYAGLISQQPHSATNLRGILRDYFALPVEIDQCIGGWYELADSDRCYLSGEHERNQLGEGAFLGDQVWDQQARFRIRLGPVDLKTFDDFLPEGRSVKKLVELTRYIVGQAMVFDVQVILRAGEVPYCRLDDEGYDAKTRSHSARLGWRGWLKTGAFRTDAGDAVSTWIS